MVKKMLNPVVAATIVMMLYLIAPIMTVIISKFITTYAYMLMCVILFCFIMLTGGITRFSTMIYLLFPAGIYIICTFFTQSEPIVILGYQGVLTLLTIATGYYFIYYRDDAITALSKVLIIALVITAITTIIGVLRFPEASRILATIAVSDDEQNIVFSWNNIGGYEFVYFCVLLYPLLILAYKQRRISRAVFLFLFLLLFSLIIIAEYTIALLLVMISSVLYFAGKRANAGQLFVIGIVLSALVFIFQPAFERFLLWLADILGSENFSDRLTALAGGVNGLENAESNRLELYQISFEAFLERPVFGNMFGKSFVGGGHSFILDCLANYGIFGGVTIAVLYRNIYRFFFAPFKYEQGYGFVLWTFSQAIILSTVNTGMWLSVIALFAPIILSLIYKTYSEDTYEASLDY